MEQQSKAHRVLNRALARYDRRERAWREADVSSPIFWTELGGPSALGMVKQARDTAGRLESIVYDGARS